MPTNSYGPLDIFDLENSAVERSLIRNKYEDKTLGLTNWDSGKTYYKVMSNAALHTLDRKSVNSMKTGLYLPYPWSLSLYAAASLGVLCVSR